MVDINSLKKELLSNPLKIKEFLELYGFKSIKIHYEKYISFARNEEGSSKSIVIRLKNNDALFVIDYPRNIIKDIFSYIILTKNVEFIDVIKTAAGLLNLNFDYTKPKNVEPFGGFYNKIKNKKELVLNPIGEDKLSIYKYRCNLRFLRDKISLKTQHFFGVRYDTQNDAIIIPIRNEYGQLCGIKARQNRDDVVENKYYYPIPTSMSQILFGYSQNYEYLVNNDVIIFEAEKSVMQCHSFGVRNCIAIGSSSISHKQAQLILNLSPKRIILAHDKSLSFNTIQSNADMLSTFSRMRDLEIYYIDMESEKEIEDKSSPSDLGEIEFKNLLENNLRNIEKAVI